MKKALIVSLALALLAPALMAETVKIDTRGTSTVLEAEKGKKLKHLYYGTRIPDSDLKSLRSAVSTGQNAYPDYGLLGPYESAIAMIQPDGNRTLDLVVDEVIRGGKWPESPLVHRKGLDRGSVTTVRLRDKVYPIVVDVNYGVNGADDASSDVVETWVDIRNEGRKPVTLVRYASGCLPLRYGDTWVSQIYGSAKNEVNVECAPLPHGIKIIKNRDGIRTAHTSQSNVMISLDGKPRENSGRVIGAALCYSGNYKLLFEVCQGDYSHFFAGIDEADSDYTLEPGGTFSTPHLALVYSTEGLGGASRAFHKWGRNFNLAHGDTPRPVLLNSWGGVYFKINEEGMNTMMRDFAGMGGELFVMDDGWFGPKYHRDNATAGLGDWTVDTRKLPGGIQGLLETAKKYGLKFGIWIEPEMVNSNSELYQKHPEYVLKAPKREPAYGRGGTQLILDLANPKVQDIVFTVVDTLLTRYPEIAYIKWDANMTMREHGSQYLPADRQGHMYVDYHRGFQKVLDRIRAKYPDVIIQDCASGGGRASWGILPWFDEFWVSDNTDALQRVYQQWGDSYFFPAIAMASHISQSPGHQMHRVVPLKYRTDVAMSGRLGVEMQPQEMTAAEREQTARAIEEYKGIRDIVQLGDLYRLSSPYDGNGIASLLYADAAKDRAVFFLWRTRSFYGDQLPRIPMAGLDPGRRYRVHELNRIDTKPLKVEGKVYSGRFLMDNGLELPYTHDLPKPDRTDWGSRVLLLEAVE